MQGAFFASVGLIGLGYNTFLLYTRLGTLAKRYLHFRCHGPYTFDKTGNNNNNNTSICKAHNVSIGFHI